METLVLCEYYLNLSLVYFLSLTNASNCLKRALFVVFRKVASTSSMPCMKAFKAKHFFTKLSKSHTSVATKIAVGIVE